jgi:Concanavalin A-like lectin/glucanases superfamily/Secretion system C-terminal sorting domain
MKKNLLLTILFKTAICFAQTPIQVFKFDNSMSNNANTSIFTGYGINPSGNTSFGTDRSGKALSALACAGGGTSYSATIANLPVGNSPRTISFWFRSDNNFQNQHIFSYGQNNTNQAHGYSVYTGSGFTSSYYGFGNDMNNGIGSTAYLQGQWYLYVCTFDGTTATIYRNGNVLGTSNRAGWNTFASTTFHIGSINGSIIGLHGTIDDLKIYDVALNSTQVTAINNHRPADIAASATLARETNPTLSSITFNYRVDAGNLPTNVTLNYGTTAGNLSNSVQISNGIVNSALTETNYTLTGLSANTTYYYTLTAENESGKTVLAERSFFTAASFSTNGLIAYFPFENGLSSHDNSHSFAAISSATPSYSAAQVGNGIMFANDSSTGNSTTIINNNSINDALTANTQYTVAFWVDNMYSSNTGPFPTFLEMFSSVFIRQALGVSSTNINRGYYDGANFRLNYDSPNINNGLNHIAIVHKSGSASDRTDCALYVNGVFFNKISNDSFITQFGRFHTKVSVGGGLDGSGNEQTNKRFRGIIDELYFYNRALTPGEVLAVMNNTNQTLGSTSFNAKNLKFNLFPNPANSILNIDLATELKSVEIYSLQGQKVLSATEKQINISGLSSGIYIVKVIDKNSAVATQKLVKN